MDRWGPYLLAAAGLAAATAARLVLDPVLRADQVWLVFLPVVFIVGWWAGRRAGALTLLGSLVIGGAWLATRSSVGLANVLATASVYAASGILFVTIAESARRQRTLERALSPEIFEESPMALAVLEGPELRITFANAHARQIVGAQDVLGKRILDVVPEVAGQPPYIAAQHVLRIGTPLVGVQLSAWVAGRSVTYLASIEPIRDHDGSIRAVLLVGVDMTTQMGVMRELEHARAQADEANRAKDEFLAMLGHELRNPLAPMTTAVTLLRMRGHHSRELDVIDRQLMHMTRLVDDLLDISRIVRGKLELHRAPVGVKTVIDKAVETVSPMLEQTGHVLRVQVPPALTVNGDVVRLTQVFANLLSNAMKFSPQGSPIDLTAERRGNLVVVRVRDRGNGIAPEMLGRIFEPFQQAAQQLDRAQGGLGLGLTIVRRLVDLHDGRVSAHSEGLGRGAEFSVELPLTTAIPIEAAPAGVVVPPHHERILVVDDNPEVAAMLAELLQQRGHAVQIAHDGPKALELAATFSPTLALLDIGLPVMDGYELAKQLRAQGTDVPMIAITGYGQERDRRRAFDAGFAEHLVKPVPADVLQRAIEHVAIMPPAASSSMQRPA
jgi:signal transduction histidine kinase/ActR/RegA family two-component response regulator